MIDERGTCVERTHLYRSLRKGPTKGKGKGPYLSKEQIRIRIQEGNIIHRRELEPPPEYDCRTGNHSMREWFIEAEKSHLESYE